MARKIIVLAALILVTAACSRSGKMKRGQQQYQTVEEGSASGVTSTINGPGETAAPITATNADTTTDFTIPTNPNPLGNDTAGTTIAGSLPPTTTYPSGYAYASRPTRPHPETREMPSSMTPPVTGTVESTTSPAPADQSKQAPATDTTTTTPTSDREMPTTTDSPTPMKKKGRRVDDPQPPPPPTDTTGTQG